MNDELDLRIASVLLAVVMKVDFGKIQPGRTYQFSEERRSIIPAGDTSQFIFSRDASIGILEEPEHLDWYRHGKHWTDQFNHAVGIIHTNYLEYFKRENDGALQAFLVKHINNWIARAYCDKVLRLSAATQDLPKSLVCNVYVEFLKIGEKATADRQSGQKVFSKGAYFLGKMEVAHEVHSTEVETMQMILFLVSALYCHGRGSCNGENWTTGRMNFSRFMEYSDLEKVLTSETRLDRRSRKGMWKSVSMSNLD
ncbi:hypothetical protein RND71_036005 [Anisodus tanguticus]|uniref:Uncharacterized protein n=1 Tax=Anisodus tanguticus TaxID=243964 RepID=A0AAE1R6X8_9SOLA|nr:hypothetical protein RND71_036005 [Anisodus tanguticus]